MPFTANRGSLMAALGVPTRADRDRDEASFRQEQRHVHDELMAQNRRGLAREKIRIGALETALKNLGADHPNRPEIERAYTELTGVQGVAAGIRPEAPAGGEGFTLSRGAQRFDPTGRLIAENPVEETRDPSFGKSQSALAMDAVIRARNAQRQGIPLSPEMRDQLAFARQILQAPRVIKGPQGQLMQVEPLGIPAQFESVFDETPEQQFTRGGVPVEPVSRQSREGRFRVTEIKPGKDTFQKDLQTASNLASDIADILVEGRGELGGVTGVVGTAKAQFGGLARQAGVPVSGRAKSLRRKLETLKAVAAPHVLGEKGRTLSDMDRRRLDQIVGTLDALSDEQDIQDAVVELIELFEKMGEDVDQ